MMHENGETFREAIPGQMFVYRANSRFRRAQSGAGQVLGVDVAREVIFVRIFNVSGDELRTLISFLPLHRGAYRASKPQVIKEVDLPDGWESLRAEWEMKWRRGDAGVFSQPLREVTRDTLETVEYLRNVPPGHAAIIELAFPKRSSSGKFDTIEAVVRTSSRGEWT